LALMTMLQIRNDCSDSVGIQVNRLFSAANHANEKRSPESPVGVVEAPADNDATFCQGPNVARLSHEPDEHTGRRDALPEFTTYRDTGCEYAPACLTCPLAQCRYDLEGRRISTNVHQLRVVELRRQGWTPGRVASELGVSRRTVFRLSK
jgi:hypothetical protein